MHYDNKPMDFIDEDEARMAKADLYKLAKYSIKLLKQIQEGQELEGWVQAKITKAADYIASVYHYFEYEYKISEYGEKIENADMYSESVRKAYKQKLNEAKRQLQKFNEAHKAIGGMEPSSGGEYIPEKDGYPQLELRKFGSAGSPNEFFAIFFYSPTGVPVFIKLAVDISELMPMWKQMKRGKFDDEALAILKSHGFGPEEDDSEYPRFESASCKNKKITELSKKTLSSYKDKAKKQARELDQDSVDAFDAGDIDKHEKTEKKINKRIGGVIAATKNIEKIDHPEKFPKKSPKRKNTKRGQGL